MSSLPVVPSALTVHVPHPNLPPGWSIYGWDVQLEHGPRGEFRRICIRADFGYQEGAKASVELEFDEGQRPDSYEWLYRLLVVAQDVPKNIRVDVDGRRW